MKAFYKTEPDWLLVSLALQHIQQLIEIADDLECLDSSYLEEIEQTLLKYQYKD